MKAQRDSCLFQLFHSYALTNTACGGRTITDFRDMTPCTLVGRHQCVTGCLHLQGRKSNRFSRLRCTAQSHYFPPNRSDFEGPARGPVSPRIRTTLNTEAACSSSVTICQVTSTQRHIRGDGDSPTPSNLHVSSMHLRVHTLYLTQIFPPSPFLELSNNTYLLTELSPC
jgi:hypothetical protein